MSADDLDDGFDNDIDFEELIDLVEENETVKSDLRDDGYTSLYDYLGD